jgi:hypothetical protein
MAGVFLLLIAALFMGAIAPAAIDLSQNVIYLTDMPTSRIVRVRDFSAAGWEEGPTIQGQSLSWPWHFTFDASGRI